MHALKSSSCPPDPLASLRLQHHSFARAHTAARTLHRHLMNGSLQNHPCHYEAANVPHRKRTAIILFCLSHAATFAPHLSELAQDHHPSYILSLIPGPVYLYYLHGISIFNIWAFIVRYAWEESYQLLRLGILGFFDWTTRCLWHFLIFNVINCTIEIALRWASFFKGRPRMRWIPPREDGGRIS
ncbi:hypothetical protein F5Y13DRAFT_159682 [Hypoxylon sp. FL1857]|nr:hypothetical protein F5Y13DRAFT_159682 [Hypoxylon sp. FL1857]